MLKFFDFAEILFYSFILVEPYGFKLKTAAAVFPIFFGVIFHKICPLIAPATDPSALDVVNAADAHAIALH
jgi:hypothetical protein